MVNVFIIDFEWFLLKFNVRCYVKDEVYGCRCDGEEVVVFRLGVLFDNVSIDFIYVNIGVIVLFLNLLLIYIRLSELVVCVFCNFEIRFVVLWE